MNDMIKEIRARQHEAPKAMNGGSNTPTHNHDKISVGQVFKFLAIGGALFVGLSVLVPMLGMTPEDWETRDPEKKAAAAHKNEDAHQMKCLSSIDGSMYDFQKVVRRSLREPDSFQHISTAVFTVTEKGTQRLEMSYRARNGFGGVNIETAHAVITHSSCEILAWQPLS